jgi:tryptophan-rich sensory protein
MTRKDEDEGGSAFAGLVWPVLILVVGLAGFLVGGYFQDNAVIGLSLLVCTFGVYALWEAVLGAIVNANSRLGGAIVIVGLGVLVFALFYGYRLLMSE